MIKIAQFGEGNFLRTFVDVYFDDLNKRSGGNYEVTIIKPITFGDLSRFKKQNCVYHVVLRGMENGVAVENVYEINSVKNAISPFDDFNEYSALAIADELKIIVSNTTEAGICFNANDKINDPLEKMTYPAKLTSFLYARFKANKGGVYILPVELIENNADELYKCVNEYISLWNLPESFKKWNDENNYYCNTLVDRIVSGYPKDEKTKAHLTELIGKEDELVSIGEPFGLWAVENKGEISKFILSGKHNIEVVLTNDIAYYKKRKVRVLNGSHTNLVPAGLWLGKNTVDECLNDKKLFTFVNDTLKNEIIPFVSNDVSATTEFAESVKERFFNPFLNHRLTSIALNSVSKWVARDLPSFKDYYALNGKIPENLTKGFAYLIALYKIAKKGADGKFYAELPARTIELKDNAEYLGYFSGGGNVFEFMKDESVWGEDLTAYNGFAETICSYVEEILNGKIDLL